MTMLWIALVVAVAVGAWLVAYRVGYHEGYGICRDDMTRNAARRAEDDSDWEPGLDGLGFTLPNGVELSPAELVEFRRSTAEIEEGMGGYR
jgi:hypothetical protein